MDINAGKDVYDDVCFDETEADLLGFILNSDYNDTRLLEHLGKINKLLPKIFGAKRHILKVEGIDHLESGVTSSYFSIWRTGNFSVLQVKTIVALKLAGLRMMGFGGFKALEHPAVLWLSTLFAGFAIVEPNKDLEKKTIDIVLEGGFSELLSALTRAYDDVAVVRIYLLAGSGPDEGIEILDKYVPGYFYINSKDFIFHLEVGDDKFALLDKYEEHRRALKLQWEQSPEKKRRDLIRREKMLDRKEDSALLMAQISSPRFVVSYKDLFEWSVNIIELLEYISAGVSFSELSGQLERFGIYANWGVGIVTDSSSWVDRLKHVLGQVLVFLYMDEFISQVCRYGLEKLGSELSEHQKNSIAYGIELDILLNKSLS